MGGTALYLFLSSLSFTLWRVSSVLSLSLCLSLPRCHKAFLGENSLSLSLVFLQLSPSLSRPRSLALALCLCFVFSAFDFFRFQSSGRRSLSLTLSLSCYLSLFRPS